MDSLMSIILIAFGSICAASFYVPIKKIKEWSWESYWIVQGVVSWILAPWIFAYFTVPNLLDVLKNSPGDAVWAAFIFGALWGVGGLTFGLSMRYLGVGLGQSVALGFTAALGTLIPPFVSGRNLFTTYEGRLILLGVALCVAGIAIVGYAGVLRSRNMPEEARREAIKDFALKKGLLIAVLSGLMSACFNFGINGIPGVIDAGYAIQKVASSFGTDPLFVVNPVYIIVMFGGFVTNFVYCMYLNYKNKTFGDYVSVNKRVLLNNLLFSLLGGTLWYLQFFFFGMGQSKLPEEMFVFGWSILMALNILFSNVWGLILKEWKNAGAKTVATLMVGLIVLILSTFVIKL
ncbi:L-rhamnose/H+ symporter [Melioribacter roseus P3M-2]|uniref:L-rhamnose/H+ symporter n=1 Tax=Melioribacter roseus (strain DSM 23840 / JCM 17771 / VKM B-2668 / P3M-2) TaxID=1191523 RepID=I6ZMS5_MELRP|nr:rhamnose/proton symporter RhaT [Melioribacter roseus]AFN73319.1 L-rhamnose/H+ symporter [Melioribacter roseus P3M-2]